MSTNLLIILGTISVIQALILPGLIILKLIKFEGSWLQKLVYIVALSLGTSYFIAAILVFLNAYNQAVLIALFMLEVLFLFWIRRDDFSVSLYEKISIGWKKFIETLQSLVDSWNEISSFSDAVKHLLSLGAFILSLTFLWWSIKLANHYAGTIFDVWDAVVSWNRWALDWASGVIPTGSRNYPQLIPANYSLSYIFMGNTSIQFFAKFLVLPMAFFILVMPFDLGIQTKRKGFFFATIITYFLLKKFLITELTNGYVDGAMAFFSLLTVYTLVKVSLEVNHDRKRQLILFGAVFAGSAAIVKQAGVYIFGLYSIWLYFGILRKDIIFDALEKRKLLWQSVLISSVLALPWYVIKQITFVLGKDSSEISNLIEVSANNNYNVGWFQQIIDTISGFDIYLILFPVIILAFFALKPLYRWLIVTLILPYPILWALIASYDTRNLSIFIPIFGLVAGLAFEKWIDWGLSLFDFGKLKLWMLTLIIVIALAVGLVAKYPNEVLSEKQFTLQSQLFSSRKNALLYDLVERKGTDVTLMTNYPLRFLSGFEEVELYDNFKNYTTFIGKIENHQVDYLLVPEDIFIDPQINDYINQKIDEGVYELVWEEKSWKYYKLLRVIH